MHYLVEKTIRGVLSPAAVMPCKNHVSAIRQGKIYADEMAAAAQAGDVVVIAGINLDEWYVQDVWVVDGSEAYHHKNY